MSRGHDWVNHRCRWPPRCPDDLGREPSAPRFPTHCDPSEGFGTCPGDQQQGKGIRFPRPRAPRIPALNPQLARGCPWGLWWSNGDPRLPLELGVCTLLSGFRGCPAAHSVLMLTSSCLPPAADVTTAVQRPGNTAVELGLDSPTYYTYIQR